MAENTLANAAITRAELAPEDPMKERLREIDRNITLVDGWLVSALPSSGGHSAIKAVYVDRFELTRVP